MSDKPSLYVVEKKEVVILVVLFVLVTVLSFTMGVRYGESVGRKSAKEQIAAEGEHGEAPQNSLGGTLGAAGGEGEAVEEKPATGEHATSGHGNEAKVGHEEKAEKHAEHGAEHGKESKEIKKDSPEAAAKSSEPTAPPSKESVDKSSDEYLLNALKEAGVEPPGGKAPKEAKLPQDVKAVKAGTFVIQVGSHPTRSEAESQIRSLKAKRVNAEILSPFKDKQGEWHRVVVGSYKNKRDAEKEAKALKSKGAIVSFFVWRLP